MKSLLVLIAIGLVAVPIRAEEPISRVAFGSCLRQDLPQLVWSAVLDAKPDLFIFLGDNVYANTRKPDVMQAHYAQLAKEPGFQALLTRVPRVIATWDDHDYGEDNAGADYPMKEASKNIFLEFWKIPLDSPLRQRAGIYDSRMFGPPGREAQVLLLDLRSFKTREHLMGEDQWRWLEEELKRPAHVRIIASSIQVLPMEHRFEKWADHPEERKRLIKLLETPGLGQVLIISGDRHHAEISCSGDAGEPRICEATASPLSAPPVYRWREGNRYRTHPEPYRKHNFGFIELDWTKDDVKPTLSIRDVSGQKVLEE